MQTTGERAGYGAGGATALQAVMDNLNGELATLAKRQRRHANAQSERRRQRSLSGAQTVGLAGYTTAGKSSLFLALSGKEVLVEDKLFSTLETTIGRLEASPRVLCLIRLDLLMSCSECFQCCIWQLINKSNRIC
jgi:GTP-binding protein HflX